MVCVFIQYYILTVYYLIIIPILVPVEELGGTVNQPRKLGGTDIYTAADYALNLIDKNYNSDDYTAAVILMTDGISDTTSRKNFENGYRQSNSDIPVFSIMFGSAERRQLDSIAELTNARVFDGRDDLIGAFRSVKGYN